MRLRGSGKTTLSVVRKSYEAKVAKRQKSHGEIASTKARYNLAR